MSSIPFSKHIPKRVLWTLRHLKDHNYEGYIIGGSVRDLILGITPKDFDLTTNAKPKDIISLFETQNCRVVCENNFGTVSIISESESSDTSRIEITPYRSEEGYSDKRHPDKVSFGTSLEDDLRRRDFTMNAMAYDPFTSELIDKYQAQKDIKDNIIRTVGDPSLRFSEDALRMMRAARFSAELGFHWDPLMMKALKERKKMIHDISAERIRDELLKLWDAPYGREGMILLFTSGLLEEILPEFLPTYGCEQGGIHRFDVWNHLLKSFEHATKKSYALPIKIAALFHDIGKPKTRRRTKNPQKKQWTFYGHEVVGAHMCEHIFTRLKFSKKFSEKVVTLVRHHMFFSDPDTITLSAVRRLVRNVGEDMIWSLMSLRQCDRIGTGRPKEKPYRLRKYHAMIEEVLRDPISVSLLKINGDMMIQKMGFSPGPKMGWILHALLEEVLDDPQKNTERYLCSRAQELYLLPEKKIKLLGEAGKKKKEKEDQNAIDSLYEKHHVD